MSSPPRSLPRIRGGVSLVQPVFRGFALSSPHTRGCFFPYNHLMKKGDVFPAYAGVFPSTMFLRFSAVSLPRIRGGVSAMIQAFLHHAESSPHTRGCFQKGGLRNPPGNVFPAYAGVFLTFSLFMVNGWGLPRIRGGVSCLYPWRDYRQLSSPHTRGCFPPHCGKGDFYRVFPAYAGVFLPVKRLRLA